MATDDKEIIVNSNWTGIQGFLPESLQMSLDMLLRGAMNCRFSLTAIASSEGRFARSILPLGVSGKLATKAKREGIM